MSIFATAFDRALNRLGYVRARPAETVEFENRAGLFELNELLYSGQAYNPTGAGGALESILREAAGPNFCDVNRFRIFPFFLPFKPIVDAYQNVLPGTWGVEQIRPADEYDGKPINDAIRRPLTEIWRASNFDTNKALLIQLAANLGTVGMRVTARPASEDGSKPARVAIGVDHPSRLFNFEEDADRNVTAVCLKYELKVNRGTLSDPDWQSVDVVEEITKEDFSVTHDGKQQLEDARRVNGLGFCPYVVLRHKPNALSPYGDWAYKGAETAIHRINWRISRQDKSVDRHQFPKWFGAAGGRAPTTDVTMGEESMTYVQTSPDTPPPILQAIVPQIDQESSRLFWQDLRDLVRTLQPEMNLNDVKMLANISGEALAQVLKPTEQAIVGVRPGYHHAIIRAMQMALSAGVVVGAWDLGTGTGNVEASDRAYREGLENFQFAPLPALPETPGQRTANANADVADKMAKLDLMGKAENVTSISRKEVLRVGGYTEEQIRRLQREQRREDATVNVPDGTDTIPGDGSNTQQ